MALLVYRQGRLVYANRTVTELSGYTFDELTGLGDPFELATPEFRELMRERAARRLAGAPEPVTYETKIRSKTGAERWVLMQASVFEIEGEPAIVATALDISSRHEAEQALLQRERHLSLAQRASRSVTWEWNPVTDRLVSSEHAQELFGVAPGEMGNTGTEFVLHVHPDDRERLRNGLLSCLKGERDLATDIRIDLGGRELWLAERAVAEFDPGTGRAVRVVGVASDITDRRRFEEALYREKERAQVTLASIGDAVIRTDAYGRVDYLNPVAEQLTGWRLPEASGRPVTEILRVVDEVSHRVLPNPVERCLALGRVIEITGRTLLLRRDGEEFAVRSTVSPLRDTTTRLVGAVAVFRDVTELLRMEHEMGYLARHDPLTGLLNRRELEARLRQVLERTAAGEGRYALCYLDLDEFKLVNDTCGHAAGDELLKQVAARFIGACRSEDALARLGGDEFAVLLQDVDEAEAVAAAEELRKSASRLRFTWRERVFDVGTSIGVVPLGGESSITDVAAALSAADAACYVAKESGRNRLHLYHPNDHALAERYGAMLWIQQIHQAFDQNRFALYHQRILPLHNQTRRQLAEIFLRMYAPDGGLISPASFIPAAERYHLAPAIDRWVVDNTLRVLSGALRSRGSLPYTFAINLSGQSLSDASFQDFVVDRLTTSQVPPASVLFEITETAAITDLARTGVFIRRLQDLGCRFVLDDFGSGLSSFTYLKNLPVDIVKIDGEFTRGIADQPVQRAIVEAIHQVAHAMGLETIGEAVEDAAALDILAAIGVDYGQGYWIQRPAPLESLFLPFESPVATGRP